MCATATSWSCWWSRASCTPWTPSRHRQDSITTLRWSEAVLTILTEAGWSALISYLNGAIQLEHLGALAGSGTAVIAALPTSDFPLLAATAQVARQVSPEAEFAGGLRILLAGLADSMS